MIAATHDGTCQVCLRKQALPGSRLSKHGYTVEHGFFEGVCPGANHLPLEVDRTIADEIIAFLRVQATEAAQLADDLTAGKAQPARAWSGNYVQEPDPRGRMRRVQEMVAFADAPGLYQRDAVRYAIANAQSRSRNATSTANSIERAADRITGKQPLTPRVKDARQAIAAGAVVRIHGKERTVLRIETRTAWGHGPYLNGQVLPHVIFTNDSGKEFGYPVRLIRQASIVKAA